MIIIEFRFKDSSEVKRYVTDDPGVRLYGNKVDGKRPISCDMYLADNSKWTYKEFDSVEKEKLKELFYKCIVKTMHPIDYVITIHTEVLENILNYNEVKKALS